MLKTLLFCCLIFSKVMIWGGKIIIPNPPKEYKVLGLSAAIVDYYFVVTDEQLFSVANEKGGWAPIDYSTLAFILEQNKGLSKMFPGGSGANVLKGLAHLGQKCALIGKLGSDECGEFFINAVKEQGIVLMLEKGTVPTGQAVCLITPDGEKTFRTYLGASHSLSELDLDPVVFKAARHFHLEGYQLLDHSMTSKALKLSKEAKHTISMNLAATEIVRRNKEFIYEIIENYVDILFCNEREAQELTGLAAMNACDKLSAFCKIVVVTMGDKGAWVRRGKERFHMKAICVKPPIDTSGAEDLYMSGFLHGYLEGASLKKCAWLGALVSSYVVKRIGPEIPNSIWTEINEIILTDGKAFDEF